MTVLFTSLYPTLLAFKKGGGERILYAHIFIHHWTMTPNLLNPQGRAGRWGSGTTSHDEATRLFTRRGLKRAEWPRKSQLTNLEGRNDQDRGLKGTGQSQMLHCISWLTVQIQICVSWLVSQIW